MGEMMQWRDVPRGATVADRNGAMFKVDTPLPALTLRRPDGTTTVPRVSPESTVEVLWLPPPPPATPEDSAAVATVREFFPGASPECPRCTSYPDDECICETHCGASHCVNFRIPLSDTDAYV